MCTASLIPLPAGGFRLVVSRDEQRSRPEALPPRWRRHGDVRAIYPVDPVGGGTWAAASDAGLALCLLNCNPLPAPPLPRASRLLSRGRVILDAIGAPRARAAVEIVERLDLDAFAPFRLLAVDPPAPGSAPTGYEVTWDRESFRAVPLAAGAVCLVSSGLGDALVAPRLDLFEDLVAGAGFAAEAQDRFHRHNWPDRPEISVLMSRRDARTVSVLAIEVEPAADAAARARVKMRYQPVPAAPPAVVSAGAAAG